MGEVLVITAPIYLLIALGYALGQRGVLGHTEFRAMGRIVLMVAMPALLLDAVSQQPIAQVLNWRYVLGYGAGSLVVMALAVWAARWRGAPWSMAGMQGMGVACSNSGYVGYPILQQLLGPAAGMVLALNVLVENLITIPAALAVADARAGANRRRALWQVLRGLATNPMVLAVLGGLLLGAVRSQLAWQLPSAVDRTIKLLAAAASPVALLVIGGNLVGLKVQGVRVDLLRIALSKLLLHPLAVALALWALAPQPNWLVLGGLVMAAVPMLGIYPVMAMRHGHERFCAAALLLTTVVSFFTLSALLWWYRSVVGAG